MLGLEWFLEGRAAAIGLRQTALAIAGDKHERQATFRQNVSDWINFLAVEINVQNGSVEFAAGGNVAGFRNRADRRNHSIAELIQHVLKQHADQILILD